MSEETSQETSLVIVSGLSGAGKSVAIRALEDIGYYCMDNIPLPLARDAVEVALSSNTHLGNRYAIGIDIRSIESSEQFDTMLEQCQEKFQTKLVFLTAQDQALITRFSTTRRKHPLLDVGGEITSAIRRERDAMKPVEAASDLTIDTSYMSPHELTRSIEERFSNKEFRRFLDVTVLSFGFKHGLLRPADTIFDVRCLPNPYFRPEMRNKSGLDAPVSSFVFETEEGKGLFEHIDSFLKFALPLYIAEGKHYFRIGIGCTGGQHRSVAIAEALARSLAASGLEKLKVSVLHRDLSLFERKDLPGGKSA